nr:hypothetical protein [Tanacetum cinerariifolium]
EGMPPPDCCEGLKKLVLLAKTQNDRNLACNCMKGFYFTSPNVTKEHSMAVETKCGVNIAYFHPGYDCFQVK